MAIQDELFQNLYTIIHAQQQLIASIADKIEHIESIGGGGSGNAVIEDYVSGKNYVRNTLVVDTNTETLYRVIEDYHSDTVVNDCANGKLKLVGFESQIVNFNHEPTQNEINALPDDTLVALYSSSDAPYVPENDE